MTETISFHRVEDFTVDKKTSAPQYTVVNNRVLLSFETRQHGFYQVEYLDVDDGDAKIKQLRNEPDLMMFTESEQYYIECVCAIVLRIIVDGSMPDFKKLSTSTCS